MIDPEEFTMVDLDKNTNPLKLPATIGSLKEYWLDLSTEIRIEKRIVNSLPSLFGEVFGINELLATFVLLLIGMFQANAFIFDQASTFFKIGNNINNKSEAEKFPVDVINGQA